MTGPLIRIVEDDNAVAASLVALLESWGFSTEVFESGEGFLSADPAKAICILLDVRLPGRDGLSVLGELTKRQHTTPVIIMTGHGDVELAVKALQQGACDFIEKPFDDEDLVARIRAVAEAQEAANPNTELLAHLTPRETEVMLEVVAGHANKVIAHRLGMSPKTVEVHRARVMAKTGAKSLSHLVRIAFKAGIDPEAEPSR